MGEIPKSGSSDSFDIESGTIRRKRSLVRRDRARPASAISSKSRNSQLVSDDIPLQDFNPPTNKFLDAGLTLEEESEPDDSNADPFNFPDQPEEQYGLNDEIDSTPLNNKNYSLLPYKRSNLEENVKRFPYWNIFCYAITFWAPAPLLQCFGLNTKERQFAWREKMSLLFIISIVGAIIAYLTFGFTRTTCTHLTERMLYKDISTGYLIVNGRAYALDSSEHPVVAGISQGSNVLYPPINAGGKDASLLFQNVNGNCKGLITPRDNCTIPTENEIELAWYMPCHIMELDGSSSPDFTWDYYVGYACHTSSSARDSFYDLVVQGDVYYTWNDVANSTRNLRVYNGNVLDLNILNWLQTDDLVYPDLFDKLKDDDSLRGYDISLLLTEPHERQIADCLVEIARVGVVDSTTLGCIASKVVLYVSLAFVLFIVFTKFFIACYFNWFVSPFQGASYTSIKEMRERDNEIDQWVDDPYSTVPLQNVPKKRRANYKGKRTGLRLSWGGDMEEFFGDDSNYTNSSDTYKPQYMTMTTEAYILSKKNKKEKSKSRSSFFNSSGVDLGANKSIIDPFEDQELETLSTDLIHQNVIPQPPVNWEPFSYPLIHTMCLITCYSEDEEGIRTTIDSVATTDYPNSHKLVVIICDGLITGAGNEKSTPEICLDMMTDLAIPEDEVKPYSYVSVAQGQKRHNMAKVYSGFYKYDETTVPQEKQQKIPVLLIVKCGTSTELTAAKPGNRGKRDSQIILMSFLQAVTFNERMTPLQFEMMKAIWQVTGLMSTLYESVLMVDADTLIYPDSLTHMNAELVKDPEIMGLCGETKISNKAQSWVTAIQVYEYYLAHHQAKAFESVFGSVTCLPGCFCMYRIKSPKSLNVWVPILSNSEIVEKYSENVLDSLHKKNLLLLGEDRYLSSLMLRAFPRRKQIFVPKAACKTVVPDTFKVLLSQRRRWINSTVHNLMELALVKDLCGAFCLSMQFSITVELIGTLVLPASITITLYVIIVAIVSKPTPTLSLILMAIVFGLPALLILVTVSNLMYIVWMLIYLLALPIWNFVLPVYSYWKFDDFSWGDTRKTEGEVKGGHGDTEGEFDGSQIIQMTWREFEHRRIEKSQEFTRAPALASVYNPHADLIDDMDYVDMDHRIA
ncbi:chitin synthase [Martiniozyma asiatica (nom. inval.)]|nr:chitin synthase [Martiniozyma asiatica]